MQKFLSKYGLAAHLAILAVAPLFLCRFFPEEAVSTVLFWLSPFVFSWILLEPSRRRDELLREARARVWRSVVRDPFFWVLLLIAAMGAIRWLNDGIRLVYDAEAEVWLAREAALPFLPGSVSGAGRGPFATALALCVVVTGCRHALGKRARIMFLFLAALFSGSVATALASLVVFGDGQWAELARCSYSNPSFIGVTFGLYLLASFFALAEGATSRWTASLPFFIVGIGGNLLGVYFFGSPLSAVVFFGASIAVILLSQFATVSRCEMSDRLKSMIVLLLSVVLPVMALVALAPGWLNESRLAALTGKAFFPEGFHEMRAALSRIAAAVWKEHPWLGSGLGSFPLDIRFNATEADWALFLPSQTAVPCGWWYLLAERGFVGVSFFAVFVLFLAVIWVWRLIGEVLKYSAEARLGAFFSGTQSIAWLALVALGCTVGLAFFEISVFRSEAILAIGAFMALSSSAFPAVRKSDPDGDPPDVSLVGAES